MIPQKYESQMFSLILSGLMSLLVSGISTFHAIGLVSNVAHIWASAWLAAWLFAYSAVLPAEFSFHFAKPTLIPCLVLVFNYRCEGCEAGKVPWNSSNVRQANQRDQHRNYFHQFLNLMMLILLVPFNIIALALPFLMAALTARFAWRDTGKHRQLRNCQKLGVKCRKILNKLFAG